MNKLAIRRGEAEAELVKLKRRRGADVLDGKNGALAEISALETEIEGLADAEGEFVRRVRDEDAVERSKRLEDLRSELSVLEARRLGAVQEANMAARTLAESIGLVLEMGQAMASVAHKISGTSTPLPLSPPDLVSRLSGRLSAVMSGIPNHANRLGSLIWHGSLYRPTDNWASNEKALMEPHLEPLLGKDTKNG